MTEEFEELHADAFEVGKALSSYVKLLKGEIIYPLDINDKELVVSLPKTSIRMIWLAKMEDIARVMGWRIEVISAAHEYDDHYKVRVHAGYKIWLRWA